MAHNIGSVDRIARVLLGVGLLAVVFTGPRAWWGLIGVVPLLTAFSGLCPIYSTIGVSTRRERPASGGRLLGL